MGLIIRYRYIFFFLIPCFFFLSGNLLKEGQGPYYLNYYDPSYVYLINSLNLVQMDGYGVGHFDHPGTTVQITGAVIIYMYHLLSNKNEDLIFDVLTKPEDYLRIISKVFGVISTIILILLGCFAYKITGNLLYSLLIQLSPFSSMEIFYGYVTVTPDNFLIPVCFCLIAVLIYYLYSADESSQTSYSLVFAFAVVTALGMATKLNFLPLAIIPFFIINGLKRKITFIALSLFLFHIIIFPVITHYSQFIEWIERLIIYSGQYGQGDPTVLNPSEFFMHLGLIFKKDSFFSFTYCITVLTLVICLIKKQKIEKSEDVFLKKQIKLLFIIFISVTIQILIVAKQYKQHYMIPSFLLSIFSLSLCAAILAFHLKKLKVQYLYALIIILISVWTFNQIIINYKLAVFQRNEAYKMEKFINDNHKENFLISTYSTANKHCALAFAVSYAGSQKERYQSVLRKIQPEVLFYNPWAKGFETILNNTSIKILLLSNSKFIVQIPINGINEFIDSLNSNYGVSNTTFKLLFVNGNGESVYEVKLNDK